MLITLDIRRLQINETTENIDRFINYNKKFGEELISYLPCYNADRIENDVANNSYVVACVLVAAGDTH
jgi:hypothetical protein